MTLKDIQDDSRVLLRYRNIIVDGTDVVDDHPGGKFVIVNAHRLQNDISSDLRFHSLGVRKMILQRQVAVWSE